MANFIEDSLSHCVKYNGQGTAFIYGEQHISWREINEKATRLANALYERGIRKGDRVIIMFHNCPEFFEANYAVQKLGAIPVPMNYRFTPREIAYQTNHAQAKAFIFEEMWLANVQVARSQIPDTQLYIRKGSGGQDVEDYDTLVAVGADKYPLRKYPIVDVELDDIAVICYTGGTTGMPKGVMLTYRNHVGMVQALVRNIVGRLDDFELPPVLEANLRKSMPGFAINAIKSTPVRWLLSRKILQKLMIASTERALGTPLAVRLASRNTIKAMMPSFPMFHDAAYQLAVLGPMMGNMTLVMPDKVSFDSEYVLKMIERERPVLLGNVPTAWRMLVDYPDIDKYDKSSVLVCATGAGVCPGALKRKIFAHFPGAMIADGFGQTEMTPVTSFRFDTDPSSIKDHCVGKPIVETRVVDEQGRDVAQGEVGEIIYRGSSVMKGYFNEPDQTASTVKDGWLYSGDLGYFDEDGDLRIVERKKECISSGGEKIFPHEVEEILLEHPQIANVCVIGIPDEKWGQSVRAIVEPKPGQQIEPDEVIAYCEGKMAGYKKPRSVVIVDKLPISPVGKVQRREVKEKYSNPQVAARAAG